MSIKCGMRLRPDLNVDIGHHSGLDVHEGSGWTRGAPRGSPSGPCRTVVGASPARVTSTLLLVVSPLLMLLLWASPATVTPSCN